MDKKKILKYILAVYLLLIGSVGFGQVIAKNDLHLSIVDVFNIKADTFNLVFAALFMAIGFVLLIVEDK